MSNYTIKYRRLILLLLPFYINLFFLPLFIHYHHSEANSIQPETATIHLHTINGHEENHHHGESGQHLDDCTDHEHDIQLDSNQFLSITKSFQFNNNLPVQSFNYYPPKTSVRKLRQRAASDLPSKLLWEKYVHNAANTSPPLV